MPSYPYANFLYILFHFHLELGYGIFLGVIVYPGYQQYIVESGSAPTVMVPTYPSGSISHYVSPAGNYPNQAAVSQTGGGAQVVSSEPYYPSQVVVATQASAAAELQGATSVECSSQGPPPAYEEKEQCVNTF